MALGRSWSFAEYGQECLKSSSDFLEVGSQDDGLELTLCMRAIGRKRIIVPNRSELPPMSCLREFRPAKRRNSNANLVSTDPSRNLHLEALPLDILVRILCGVDHEDLKQLYLVSKTIKAAAMVAKDYHFAFSTPKATRSRSVALDSSEVSSISAEGNTEAPNAPLRHRYAKARSGKKFAEISVNLFCSAAED
ncbi:F-box protein SKIP27 [Nymphaea colorata]|nr:F-box protein SKIP27 [Nymphaea colorata]